ncbi:MAG TPA: ribosome biogenesis GTP-binding protein YihA/YsxC, partial [Dokdonella sp.]
GRTQQIVVFPLADPARRLIDLPGYGYAKVPESLRLHWRGVLDEYLRTRASLKGVVLVMDVRHPLKEFDRQMLAFCAASARPCHGLLTKSDKLSQAEAARTLAAVRKTLAAEFPGASAQLLSSTKKTGLDEARAVLAHWLFGVADTPAVAASGG